ncbi:S8 family serine peptidase [Streptomyces sp. NPDC059785]|uniref:S8 family serine peptidase n=1 Tax=unclassified Streptomyces TaxID=2593676 RepID=UPI00365C3366
MAYRIDNRLPSIVYAQASPRSRGDVSLFAASSVDADNAADFVSEDEVTSRAVDLLREAGFRIITRSPATLNIAGPPGLYEDYFGTRLTSEVREVIQPGAVQQRRTSTYLDSVSADMPGLVPVGSCTAHDVLEGVALEQPATTMSYTAPPEVGYWHLTLDRVAELLDAEGAHRRGITGEGVRLTMVDTGWEYHPYFRDRQLAGSVIRGPETIKPDVDEDGHGTGESANAFAVAPGIDFTMVKANFTNLTGAFNEALNQPVKPQIISNSWGYQAVYPPLDAIHRVLEVSVSLAVAEGIVVVCAAGNGHHAYPAQHREVIAAGGVYLDEHLEPEASNYASGFMSAINPGRIVPDVCGLVGKLPSAAYIMLPVPPGSEIDRHCAAFPYPDGDDTSPYDGWAALSGTSAAAPQLAGACALLLQARPDLKPAEIRDVLQRSARDVVRGSSNPLTGGRAKKHPDDATGYGLVRVGKALDLIAKDDGASEPGY